MRFLICRRYARARVASCGLVCTDAPKWAPEGISQSAAYVYADWGIRSNVIQPGWIDTDLTASMKSEPMVKHVCSPPR